MGPAPRNPRATAPVSLTIVRSGGVTGLRRAWTVDPARLSPAVQRVLRTARVQKSRNARDLRQYEFVVARGNQKKSLLFDDQTLPTPLRALVDNVSSGSQWT